MDSDHVLDLCDQIDALVQQIRNEVTVTPVPPDPDTVVLETGDDLQAALTAGGPIELAAEACFDNDGAYRVPVSGTSVIGRGANVIHTTHDHAFDVPVNVDHLAFGNFLMSSPAPEAFQLGVNGTSQNTVDLAPDDIVIDRVISIGHRGKRAFDVNAGHVVFNQCQVSDCYSLDNIDSQAICILNAPGPVLIDGGYFEAASENVMVGGDTMKIPDCRPTGITIRNATFTKPLAWQSAGNPKVKNLIELKDGNDVLIENCDLTNSWASAQDGFGFMFTPSNGGSNLNVIVRNCRMSNVAGIVNVVGMDKSGKNLNRSQITFSRGDYQTNKLQNGGRGIFALIGESPEWFIAEDCIIRVDGTAFVDIYDKKPVDVLRIVKCDWNYPKYGIRIGGYNHGEDYYHVCGTIEIAGNVIRGAASAFKTRYPDNTYLESYRYSREAEALRHGVLHEDKADTSPPRF